MRVEPAGKFPNVPRHGEPAVLATGMDSHSDVHALFLGAFLEPGALLQWGKGVFVAMVNKDGRHVRVNVVDR